MNRTRRTTKKICLPLLAVALATEISSAQLSPNGNYPPLESVYLDGPAGAPFKRSCSGDFDGDHFPDIAFVRGELLQYVQSPGIYGCWLTTGFGPGTANDLVTLPRVGTASMDSFVAAGSAGLVLYTDTSTSLQGQLLTSTAFLDSQLVEAVDLLETQPRIVAVMSDNRTIRQLRWVGAAYVEELITLTVPLPAGEEIMDIEIAGLSGPEGNPALALVTDESLHVYDISGVWRYSYTDADYTATALAAGRMGTGAEWVAVSRVHNTSGDESVTTYDRVGQVQVAGLSKKPGIVGMTALRWDHADGDWDLALSLQNMGKTWILTNTGTTLPTFVQSKRTTINHPGGGAGNMAQPATADVELDGDADLMLPLENENSLSVHSNAALDEYGLMASLPPVMPNYAIVGADAAVNPNGMDIDLTLRLSLPPPNGATDLEVAVWRQGNPNLNTNNQANPSPPQSWPIENVETHGEIVLRLEDYDALILDPGEFEDVLTDNLYYFELLLVDNNQSPPAATRPAVLLAVQLQGAGPTTNRSYINSYSVEQNPTYPEWEVSHSASQNDSVLVGSINLVANMPGLEEEEILYK